MIAEADKEPGIAADSLLGLTWIAILRGQTERSRELGSRAYKLAEESGEKAILARATMRIADFDKERNYDNCLSYLKKSYELYSEIDDLNGIAITQLNMGNTAIDFKQYVEAGKYYSESLETYESLGNQWGIANCLGNLGNVAYTNGDYSKSLDLHIKSLAISKRIGDGEGEVICNLNLGRDAKRLENPLKSHEHYREALKKAASLGLLPLAIPALLEIAKKMIEDQKPDYAASALFFIQRHIDLLSCSVQTEIRILLDDVLNELPEEKLNEIRLSAESLSLPAIAEIVLEVS